MPARDDRTLFREAVRDVRPLKAKPRVQTPRPRLPAVPVQSILDEHAALRESAAGIATIEDALASGEEQSFVRPGYGHDLLRELRRGHWVVQGELDLHGMNAAEARDAVSVFLARCARRGVRCARIIHGKGLRSPNREPVLKAKLQAWLPRRAEVLAFCQARAVDGGGGAMLVLLAPKERAPARG